MAKMLGKQILSFRILTKRRAYLGLGIALLPLYLWQTFEALRTPGFGIFDLYPIGGVLIAALLLAIGRKIPANE